jgi:hypothetical protein
MDHAVQYRVFGLLKETVRMLSLKSDLRKSMIDILHKDGIEIVSPSFMNRREFSEEKSFIAQAVEPKSEEPSSESNVESIAFDKAEEADSIEKLKENYTELIEKKENLTKKIEDESDKTRKKEMEEEIEHIKKKTEVLSRFIEKRQEQKKKKNDE